jgi:hypothetical protein
MKSLLLILAYVLFAFAYSDVIGKASNHLIELNGKYPTVFIDTVGSKDTLLIQIKNESGGFDSIKIYKSIYIDYRVNSSIKIKTKDSNIINIDPWITNPNLKMNLNKGVLN